MTHGVKCFITHLTLQLRDGFDKLCLRGFRELGVNTGAAAVLSALFVLRLMDGNNINCSHSKFQQ